MNVRDFEYIIEIANQRSISKAAASLFVSQPALSKYVQRMEESLGVRLFQRVGKQFIPTYAGERCVEKARQILSLHEQMVNEMRDISMSRAGKIALGVPMGRTDFFMSGIMPNAYNVQKKKLEHGSYYQARAEYCANWGASITWGARAERYGAGKVVTKSLENSEQQMKEKYFVTTTVNSPSHSTYSNPQGIVGQLTRTNGQVRMTIDAGKAQIYANEANGENRKLKLRQEKDYEYQFILVWEENEEHTTSAENFIMDSNHWEYNDKKSHVKFFIENYATDHYYMDQEEWKARKKAIKEEYGSSMTLEQVAEYERKHNVPELSPVTIQAIGKLKSQW